MKDVTPTSLLKDRKREIEGNPDFSNKDVGASQSQMISDIKPGLVPPVNQVELPPEVSNPSNSGAHPHMLPQVCFPYFLSGVLATVSVKLYIVF
jgi:CCR4-NOT transcription complex subunit 1